MRTQIAIAVSLFTVACGSEEPPESMEPGTDAAAEAAFEDPEVARIHDRMMGVIAPDDGWERARYLEFDWAVNVSPERTLVRSHRWDRWTGDVRFEAPADDGTRVAVFNTSDPTAGRVWEDGEELTGEAADEALNSAYRAHINDSYWLVMPFKWSDPGVSTSYLGEQTDEEGRTWEVVELSFEPETGITPQNMYHAFINPETGRMERWHHFSDSTSEASPSDWTDWQRYGPIELAENRMVDGSPRIFFPHLRVETEVPEGAFDPPEAS